MSRTLGKLSLVVACTSGVLFGCGVGTEQGEDADRSEAALVGGKADIPSWLKHIAVEWPCDTTLKGKFTGWDSAHMYSFAGKVGYEFTYSFTATYPRTKGAVIAVYDSETGARVAYARNRLDNQVKVTYRAEKSIKYLVAVYSVAVYAVGSYDLRVDCKRVFVTCQNDGSCEKSEFCRFDKGCGKVGLGVCTTVPGVCTFDYKPVCGCDGKTYGNACAANAARVSVDHDGACAFPRACEQGGGYCAHFQDTCKAGFVGGAPMDCPLGKSAQCCQPAVRLTTDKQAYLFGNPVVATVLNLAKESVFLGGCSVLAWEAQQADGSYGPATPDKICVWEGIAGELKAGTSMTESVAPAGPGTYRLVAGYALGCTPGKPLSQAGCTVSGIAQSAPFVVKTCKMLSMPNPNAFCPQGKIEPVMDADGVCIASYRCLPCQVADCGPAMGQPNKLCDDGVTVAGPTGKCLPSGWGTCGWEVISCPAK